MEKEGRITKHEVLVELPTEIVIEILLRLPVKSLLRFKTACQSWYSIINSTEFVKKHLNLAHAARFNQHKSFIGIRIPKEHASYPCVLYTEDVAGIHAREFEFPHKLFVVHNGEIRVCNSCNGLICFTITWDRSILIWNPCLPTEYKIIQSQWIPENEPTTMVYDPTSDDYKIVKFPIHCYTYEEDYISVSIFSLKSDSWSSKRISINKPSEFHVFIYANNGIYGYASILEAEETDCIVYFDLAEESLDYMNFPSEGIHRRLINFKESIAIVGINSEGQQGLWVLEDRCGMKSSWNKIFSLNVTGPLLFFDHLSFTLNGEILVCTYRGDYNKYDIKDGSLEPVEVQGDKIAYIEECSYLYLSASPYI
ncbi:F-box and associated interaction domains-containing protein [Euphorbia peplus]|nr:F-box and associated interaction domains-containing protein [Euphorbia peplus]